MGRKYRAILALLGATLGAGIIAAAIWYFSTHTVAVFEPKGTIGHQQRQLIFLTLLMSTVVVVPVFIILAVILSRYRVDKPGGKKKKATYSPNLDHNRLAETIWWIIPGILIAILSVIAWRSSHNLDPYKPLNSSVKPVTIQVVALQWKWLFLYPEYGIASVNYVQFPEKTPVNFVITADAPMNSFWIPQLGGQVYAMTGMSTKLHLTTDGVGTYAGSSANISGKGFAGMKFTAQSRTNADFAAWVQATKQSSNRLTQANYPELAKPSENVPATTYSTNEPNLYDTIVMKYMGVPHATEPHKEAR